MLSQCAAAEVHVTAPSIRARLTNLPACVSIFPYWQNQTILISKIMLTGDTLRQRQIRMGCLSDIGREGPDGFHSDASRGAWRVCRSEHRFITFSPELNVALVCNQRKTIFRPHTEHRPNRHCDERVGRPISAQGQVN